MKTNSHPAGKKSENEIEEGFFLVCGKEQRIAYTIKRKNTHTLIDTRKI